MSDNKKEVSLGKGVGNEVKTVINKESSEFLTGVVKIIFAYLKDKAKDIPEAIEHLLNSSELRQEIVAQWSDQLAEEGLIPKGYSGLPEKLLIANLHQDGYLDGLYAG